MRVKRGYTRRRKVKRTKKETRGFLKSRRSSYKKAKEASIKAGSRAYFGRRKRKRDLRRLWIIRLNAATRNQGMKYSEFINQLKKKKIELDRKILADIAVKEPEIFKSILEDAKK